MSKISITPNASGTGVFTISSPATNTDRTLTLPDEAGTVLTSASTVVLPKGGPTFRAYRSGTNQTVSNGVTTKVQYNAESWDITGCYDNASNYRFQPSVSGYYQINANVSCAVSSSVTRTNVELYKNGGYYSVLHDTVNYFIRGGGSDMVAMNGTTDYVEIYYYIIATSPSVQAGSNESFFSASLVGAS